MKSYFKLRKNILDSLKSQLPNGLYYHSLNHTLNVLETCNKYIKRQHLDVDSARLLRIGALSHDVGFTVANENHEEHGAKITGDLMDSYGFNHKEIAIVKGLIMATKIPQSPKTELEKILCDSDLDYLGRSDFYSISQLLYEELYYFSKVKTKAEWTLIQIKFLENHSFHTEFAIKYREPQKEKHLKELIQSIS